MATYSLSGSGTQALTAGTGALRVHVTGIPSVAGNGRANPVNLYDVGLIRQGDGTDWWRAESVDAEHMLLPLLQGTVEIGYALLNGATVDVVEVIGSSPFYPPPSSGSVTLATESAERATDLAVGSSAWTDVVSVTLAAGTWLVWADLVCSTPNGIGVSIRITDGSSFFGGQVVSIAAGFVGNLHVTSEPIVLAGSTVIKLQAWCDLAATVRSDWVTGQGNPSKTTHIRALQVG